MSDKTAIEWTDATWNPTRGCTKVSDECTNCYAMGIAHRFSGPGQPYEGLTRTIGGRGEWNGRVTLVPHMLDQPSKWGAPRLIFVNSMSDLFHADVPFAYVDRVFEVMSMNRRHRFQILTKRPDRLLEYAHACIAAGLEWPLPNVWLGVSAGRRKSYDEFVPVLRQVSAAVRFISAEPLLEDLGQIDLSGIGWVIGGGESGPRARWSNPDWYRSLRNQCAAASVPFLFKQWGEWGDGDSIERVGTAHHGWWEDDRGDGGVPQKDFPGPMLNGIELASQRPVVYRVGKKHTGRFLDGVEHNGFPGAA